MYNIISRNVKEAQKAERVRVRVRVSVCLMDAYTRVWEMNKNVTSNVHLWSVGKKMIWRRGILVFIINYPYTFLIFCHDKALFLQVLMHILKTGVFWAARL